VLWRFLWIAMGVFFIIYASPWGVINILTPLTAAMAGFSATSLSFPGAFVAILTVAVVLNIAANMLWKGSPLKLGGGRHPKGAVFLYFLSFSLALLMGSLWLQTSGVVLLVAMIVLNYGFRMFDKNQGKWMRRVQFLALVLGGSGVLFSLFTLNLAGIFGSPSWVLLPILLIFLFVVWNFVMHFFPNKIRALNLLVHRTGEQPKEQQLVESIKKDLEEYHYSMDAESLNPIAHVKLDSVKEQIGRNLILLRSGWKDDWNAINVDTLVTGVTSGLNGTTDPTGAKRRIYKGIVHAALLTDIYNIDDLLELTQGTEQEVFSPMLYSTFNLKGQFVL